MAFYLVGNKYDSGNDEIFQFITGNDVVGEHAEVVYYHQKDSVFGEKVAKRITKQMDASKLKTVLGEAKLELLKAIDKWYDENVGETFYFKKAKDIVVYEIIGV